MDFRNLDSGAFISNIVSQGQNDKDLYLTFFFEWPFPNIQSGSTEEKDTTERLWNLARETVKHTIDSARAMIRENRLASA